MKIILLTKIKRLVAKIYKDSWSKNLENKKGPNTIRYSLPRKFINEDWDQ